VNSVPVAGGEKALKRKPGLQAAPPGRKARTSDPESGGIPGALVATLGRLPLAGGRRRRATGVAGEATRREGIQTLGTYGAGDRLLRVIRAPAILMC